MTANHMTLGEWADALALRDVKIILIPSDEGWHALIDLGRRGHYVRL